MTHGLMYDVSSDDLFLPICPVALFTQSNQVFNQCDFFQAHETEIGVLRCYWRRVNMPDRMPRMSLSKPRTSNEEKQ